MIIFLIFTLLIIIKIIIFITQIILFLIWTLWIIREKIIFIPHIIILIHVVGVDASRPNMGVGVGVDARVCPAPGQGRSYAMWHSVCLEQGSGSRSASCPCVGSTRCPLPMACSPSKTCADNFLSNRPFNAKCTSAKRQPHPSPTAIATLCVKGWAAITLLLCVYVNSKKDTEPF